MSARHFVDGHTHGRSLTRSALGLFAVALALITAGFDEGASCAEDVGNCRFWWTVIGPNQTYMQAACKSCETCPYVFWETGTIIADPGNSRVHSCLSMG